MLGVAGAMVPRGVWLVCAHAFALVVAVHGQAYCSYASFGLVAGREHVLRDVYLEPRTVDHTLAVDPEHMFECKRGVAVRVCDSGAAPELLLLGLDSVRVRRALNATSYGVVHTAVYCPPHGR